MNRRNLSPELYSVCFKREPEPLFDRVCMFLYAYQGIIAVCAAVLVLLLIVWDVRP